MRTKPDLGMARPFNPMQTFALFNFILIFLFSLVSINSANGQVDTLICDNGGFEDDFQYYEAERTTYTDGSDSCRLVFSGNPVVWQDVLTLPSAKEFEIVTTGIDPLVGFDMVKFGNKALKLNNQYGHTLPSGTSCSGSNGVNKLSKRFKVTEENRDFTIWYAAVLENPNNHINSQPFVNIQCDRAPNDELCLDADFLECEEKYSDPNCSFDGIDALDWSCHRFKIPEEFIDSIAVIEMTVGDCGCGAHFGYGYIDGMCEECDGSTLGSGNLPDYRFDGTLGISSCSTDLLTICGKYQLPLLCGTWDIDTVTINGLNIVSMDIDRIDSTYCFEIDKDSLGIEECLEIFAEFTFTTTSNNMVPIQISNSLEVCKGDFRNYFTAAYIGDCREDGADNNLSNDYYFVDVPISGTEGDSWEIIRSLTDPYPNESGSYTVKTGSGDETLKLGPFLIQEGEWLMTIIIGGCSYYHYIIPPDYCSGCEEFQDIEISNIQCFDPMNTPNDPSDDTWSFDINVPGDINEDYKFVGQLGSYDYGTNHPINGGLISEGCQSYRLSDVIISSCFIDFTICPPQPCSSNINCDMSVYTTEVLCRENDPGFYIEIDLQADGQYYCYRSSSNAAILSTSPDTLSGSLGIGLNEIGPFDADTYIEVYRCNSPSCNFNTCNPSPCYKLLYIPQPDCDDRDHQTTTRYQVQDVVLNNEVIAYPNPLINDRLTVESTLPITRFNVYDIRGNLISKVEFEGSTHQFDFDYVPGLYMLQYTDSNSKPQFIKFVKQ